MEAEEAGKEGVWDGFSTKEIMKKRAASLPKPVMFDAEAAIKDAFDDPSQQASLLKVVHAMQVDSMKNIQAAMENCITVSSFATGSREVMADLVSRISKPAIEVGLGVGLSSQAALISLIEHLAAE